jgi:hypothetical protein
MTQKPREAITVLLNARRATSDSKVYKHPISDYLKRKCRRGFWTFEGRTIDKDSKEHRFVFRYFYDFSIPDRTMIYEYYEVDFQMNVHYFDPRMEIDLAMILDEALDEISDNLILDRLQIMKTINLLGDIIPCGDTDAKPL